MCYGCGIYLNDRYISRQPSASFSSLYYSVKALQTDSLMKKYSIIRNVSIDVWLERCINL